MRRPYWLKAITVAVAVALATACGRNSSPALDDALKSDLALAAQTQPYTQPISPNEAGYAAQQQYASQSAPRALPAISRQPVAVRRAPVRRTSSSASSSGAYYPSQAPAQPPTTIEKNTGRDAAIGAVAGAVIGATSSRNKVQGGLIGAAIGGILGGVVGNNVDVKKKVGW